MLQNKAKNSNAMANSTVMDFNALIDEIERLSKKRPNELLIDDKSRAKLRDATRNLSIAMESRNDSAFRISYLVGNVALLCALLTPVIPFTASSVCHGSSWH